MTEALTQERATSAATTRQALDTQQAQMQAAASALDGQLRSTISRAAADAAASSEQWEAAIESRLSRFASVLQRSQDTSGVLFECATPHPCSHITLHAYDP